MRYLYIFFILTVNIIANPSLKEINKEFNSISQKYDIPAPLLKALAYKQSTWNVNFGKDDEMNQEMYGIMGLYQDNRVSSVQYGAKLLNLDPIYGIINYKWNIEMSAKILSEIKQDYINAGDDINKIEDYYNILIDYFDYDESIKVFAEGLTIKIYKLINLGYTINSNKENLKISGYPIDISGLSTIEISKFYKTYTEISSLDDIEFIYTSNKYDGRAGHTIDQIVIHLMQGYFEGTISHFKNSSTEVSAHYLVGQDGEIVQMVKVSDRAWHAGDHNNRSIGIEHAGFDGASYHDDQFATETEYQASAMLVRWLTERYNIPRIHRDAYHDANGNFVPWHLQRPELSDLAGILGHHDCNGKELCPGPHWNWAHYMELVVGANDLEGEITVITPKPNEIVDNPVVFKCKVDGDIKKVKYFADNTYLLGESSDKDNDFRVEYQFAGVRVRNVSFKGYDENDNLVASSVKSYDIEIVEAGEGSVLFKTPLDNTTSTNPVILETNVTGDIAKVKYYAENTIFLGESTDKDNNFKVIRAFNQPGNRILQVIGYNNNDIQITNAKDEVSVIVPQIDDNIIEECVDECSNDKEKRCNINGGVDICSKVDDCLIWQSEQECGGDEYCDDGACLRRETTRECKDECTFVNQKECRADSAVLVCKLDKDNCLKLYLEESCQDGFVCQVGKCMNKNQVKNESDTSGGCSFGNGNNYEAFLILLLMLIFSERKLKIKK